ncbi:hypothetical protein GCM10010372_84400 [Streptomyces tauricus]|nr:hypothetical protein GCM10010372_84400 [Streptomyces tauricus]
MRGDLMAADAAGDMALDEARCRAVEEIVEAVRSGKHWRAGVLLEQFVAGADLPALACNSGWGGWLSRAADGSYPR